MCTIGKAYCAIHIATINLLATTEKWHSRENLRAKSNDAICDRNIQRPVLLI